MVSKRFQRFLCQTSGEPFGLVVAHASGVHVTTVDGRSYLDLTAGIGVANVGHSRPEIARAVEAQLARHAHVMVYGEFEQPIQTAFAEALIGLLPESMEQVFLTSTGTEAVEGALKVARKATGRERFVAFEGSYHGDTMGSLSVMSSPRYRAPFEPLIGPVAFLPFGAMDGLDAIDTRTAAVIVEPVQGEGGFRVPPEAFLPALRARCDATGAILIFDEVLTGFGRTGEHFAMAHWGATPDIVCMAKAMGGGLPLGGFAGPRRILETLSHDPPLSHVTTFGGNPVACAAGLAALRILVEERLAERASVLGMRFRDGLAACVGRGGACEVRGIGLMLGLGFEDAGAARRFVRRALDGGLILGWTLHCDDVVRLTPPLVITEAQVDEAILRVRDALS
jgi:acetylornithine/succinyldiaminopimelate/putrescine aminotransferase